MSPRLGILVRLAIGFSILFIHDASRVDGQQRQENTPSKGELQFFESKVRPLLIERCYGCHSENMPFDRFLTAQIPGRGSEKFEERVILLWQTLLTRSPSSEELEWARYLWTGSDNSDAGWVSLVRGLLAIAEYRYVD